MAKYSIFFKITEPLFFVDTNCETAHEAEEEFKKKLMKNCGSGTEFPLKLNDRNTKIIKVFENN